MPQMKKDTKAGLNTKVEQSVEKELNASFSGKKQKVEKSTDKEIDASFSKKQQEVGKEEVLRKELQGYGLTIGIVESLIENYRGRDFYVAVDENNELKVFDTSNLEVHESLEKLAKEKGVPVVYDSGNCLREVCLDDGFWKWSRIETVYDRIHDSKPDIKEDLENANHSFAKVAKYAITKAQEETDGSQEEMIKSIKGLKEIYKGDENIPQKGFDLAIDTINERVRKEKLYNELPQLLKDFADTYDFEDIEVPSIETIDGVDYPTYDTVSQNKTDFAYGRGTNTLIAKDAYLVAQALGSEQQVKEWSELDQEKRHEMISGLETDKSQSSLALITTLAIGYLKEEQNTPKVDEGTKASISTQTEEEVRKESDASFSEKKQEITQDKQEAEKKIDGSFSEKQQEISKEEKLRKELMGYGLNIGEAEAVIEQFGDRDFYVLRDKNNKIRTLVGFSYEHAAQSVVEQAMMERLIKEIDMPIIHRMRYRNGDLCFQVKEKVVSQPDRHIYDTFEIETIYDRIRGTKFDIREDLEKWANDKPKGLEIECEKLEDEIKKIKSDLDSHNNEDLIYVTKKKKLLDNYEKLLHEKELEKYRLKNRSKYFARVAKYMITKAQEKTDGSQEEMIKYIKGINEIYKDDISQEGFDLAIDTINERVGKENLHKELPQYFKDWADSYDFGDVEETYYDYEGEKRYRTVSQNKTDFAYGRGTNTLIAKDAYLVAKTLGTEKQVKEWSELDREKRHEMVPGLEDDPLDSSIALITDLATNYLKEEREKMRARRRKERKEAFSKMVHRVTDLFKSKGNK